MKWIAILFLFMVSGRSQGQKQGSKQDPEHISFSVKTDSCFDMDDVHPIGNETIHNRVTMTVLVHNNSSMDYWISGNSFCDISQLIDEKGAPVRFLPQERTYEHSSSDSSFYLLHAGETREVKIGFRKFFQFDIQKGRSYSARFTYYYFDRRVKRKSAKIFSGPMQSAPFSFHVCK